MPIQRLVRAGNKNEMAAMLIDNEVTSEGFYLSSHKRDEQSIELFEAKMNYVFEDIQWQDLCQKMYNGTKYIGSLMLRRPIARVKDVFAFRNGNNLAHYNFAIYSVPDNKFQFRQNIDDTVQFVRICTRPVEDLPLMIGLDMCQANKELFDKKLKEGTI